MKTDSGIPDSFRPLSWQRSVARVAGLGVLALACGWSFITVYLLACGENWGDAVIPVATWRMERHVRPDHPLIQSWAADVRRVTADPREQVAVAEQTVWHLVRYWDAYEIWGCNNCIPSIDEIVELAREKGWSTLRGNCVSQSIMLCSLLRELGIEASIKCTPSHAWVCCRVQGEALNLLFPVSGQTSDEVNLPPGFLRGDALAAAQRLGADEHGRFGALPFLAEKDQPLPYFSQPALLVLLLPLMLGWRRLFLAWDAAMSGTETPVENREVVVRHPVPERTFFSRKPFLVRVRIRAD